MVLIIEYIIGGCFLIFIVFYLFGVHINRAEINAKLERYSNRSELMFDELYEEYYHNSKVPKDLILEVLSLISQCIGIPIGLLRPKDRFDSNLIDLEPFDGALHNLKWEAEHYMKTFGVNREIIYSENVTIEDLINNIGSAILKSDKYIQSVTPENSSNQKDQGTIDEI